MKKLSIGFLILSLVLILEAWIAYLHYSVVVDAGPVIGAWMLTVLMTFFGGLIIVIEECT